MLPAISNSNTHNNNLDSNSSNQKSSLKRSSSMIFRIEHLLPSTAATEVPMNSSYLNTSSTTALQLTAGKNLKHVRAGVHVSQYTPKDTVSQKLSTISLLSSSASPAESHGNARSYCQMTQGELCISAAIMRKIKLSEDIHSYNALFEIHDGAVRIRVMKDIASNDELVAWFGEEITLLMAIPFLTPLHIQGNNRYTCHLCHLTFETPNPLKIHLALGCGRQSMDILWIRLHYALIKNSSYEQVHSIMTAVPSISHSPNRPQQASSSSSITISPAGSPQPAGTTTSSNSRLSAFKPIASSAPATTIIPTSHTITSMANSLSLPTLHSSLSYLSPLPTSSSALPSMSLLQPPNPLNAAAQIEAIVSNMGASKQGHLCIYCGKVYSRKYGLKIHIRTHTGFKPLKCKFCLRPFGDPSNLNKHVRLHLQSAAAASVSSSTSGDNIIVDGEGHQCHLCHKILGRRRDLQRHMETRHSETNERHLEKSS